jgi:hypothetical protein
MNLSKIRQSYINEGLGYLDVPYETVASGLLNQFKE